MPGRITAATGSIFCATRHAPPTCCGVHAHEVLVFPCSKHQRLAEPRCQDHAGSHHIVRKRQIRIHLQSKGIVCGVDVDNVQTVVCPNLQCHVLATVDNDRSISGLSAHKVGWLVEHRCLRVVVKR